MSLLLNFSPIDIDDTEIEVSLLPYGSNGQQLLKQLRQDHWTTHVFRREGANQIVAVPINADAPILSNTHKKIRLKDNLGLTSLLIRNSLLNYLVTLKRPVLLYDPIRFITQKDILQPAFPAAINCPEWLSMRILCDITVRPLYFFKQEPFIAAIFDVRTTRIINRTVADLILDGFSPIDHYVTQRIQKYDDSRIEPKAELLGRVSSVNGSTLFLTDTKDGTASVNASNVWFEKRSFPAVLAHVLHGKDGQVVTALQKARSDLSYGPLKLERIEAIVKHFASKPHVIAPGASVRFSGLLSNSENGNFPVLESTPKPIYVFDQSASKTSTWNDGGLNKHGPYTAKVFTPTRPKLCVICQKSQKGRLEEFLHKFINGISLSSAPRHAGGKPPVNYFENGFLRKYALQDVTYEFFFAEDRSPESYKEACRQAIEKHGDGTKWDLALVQIEESFHQLPVDKNPYFITKESFLTHQIPVQEFEIETAQKPDNQLAYCLNNMALATYAKLNGIPWLLKANPTIAHELVIGLGSANIVAGRLGERERYVGITTVFSGDGNYYLSNVSKAVPMENFKAAFLDALRKTITKVQQDMNWQQKDHIRLIFHASFKRFNQDEVSAVKELMTEFSIYEVEYAFLQLSEQHPYLLFDTEMEGKIDYESRLKKGVFAPARSLSLQLSGRDMLLCLTGPSEVKRPQDGLPSPLLLTLHRDSTFTDMTYLTRQVFAFACHSWRTLLPASLPVTIQYSDLIAKTLGNLSLFDRWNPDVMLGKIGKTRWFL